MTILSSVSLISKYQKTEEEEKRAKHVNRIKSSVNNLTVWSVDICNNSETPLKTGWLSLITHANGEIDISQSVNLYKASIVLSGDIPEGSVMDISTCSDVLSSIFFILILPLSFALIIELINEEVFDE